ncbi:MAG: PQQ-dependent sugar dehydrogenase [Planctomycetes bacterium]|nr:PQQ-dependent sugar dehydrogenase [Planctomycetota bacterium]
MNTVASFVLPAGALLALAAASRCQTPTPLRTELFGTFTAPVQLLSPPGDSRRIFVVEKTGQIRVVRDGVVLPTPFLDLGANVLVNYEQGLLGMAFHPDYRANGYFFVDYTQVGTGTTIIARYRIQGGSDRDRADASSALTLLSIPQPYANHNGGTLRFGRDGLLYIGMGDGGLYNDPNGNAQNVDSLLGKMLRIDVDHPQGGLPYGIPAGNPFVGAASGRAEVLCLGLRNPWQWSFDRITGDLYIGDVGQDTQEEIDFVAAADLVAPTPATVPNFGWRCMEGTWCTGLSGCTCGAPALRAPLHSYATVPGYAVIGGFVYRGCAIPDLRGTYFFGNHSTGAMWSLRVVNGLATNLTSRTSELDPPGGDTITGITAFGEDACGELYVLEHAGQVWKIVPAGGAAPPAIVAFGSGTAGCDGAHTLTANCPPSLQNNRFEFVCSKAPANGIGLAALAYQRDLAGSDPFGIGLVLHVSMAPPPFVWLALADVNGIGTAALSIPDAPQLIGEAFHAQLLWFWPPGTCAPSAVGLSSSPGLTITLMP